MSRQDLFRLQAHALLDGIEQCPGGMPDKRYFDAQMKRLPCPMCLRWKAFDELQEDHAPQRKKQSRLGYPRVVVMTCRDCNGGAGRSYERDVYLEDRLLEVPAGSCPVHSKFAETAGGLIAARDFEARAKVDIKSAFLIATATLGYRWAAAPRLDRIRGVLRGELALILAANDYHVLCNESGVLAPFTVSEVLRPIKAILVTGAYASVLLPAARSPRTISGVVEVELSDGTRRISATLGQRFAWPRDFTRSTRVEQVWDDVHAGNLFHYDRCTEESHHAGLRLSPVELAAAVGPPISALRSRGV